MPSEDELPVEALDPEGLLRVLLDHDVPFIVIGGFSLAAHGVVRGTKDVDIVPSPDPADLGRLAAALRDLEAEPLLANDFAPEELGIGLDPDGLGLGGNWVLRTRLGRLDVMQDVPGVDGYPDLLEGAVTIEFPRVGPVRFAGLDDLVAMKHAAGRPQDRVDVERLRDANP